MKLLRLSGWFQAALGLGLALGVARYAAAAGGLAVSDLRCEYTVNPVGVEPLQPRLSWKFQPLDRSVRGARATTFQIIASSSARALADNQADLWDSRRRVAEPLPEAVYEGRAPAPGEQVFWKVRVWDGAAEPSAWSEPATWTAGLDARAWGGTWIAAGPQEAALPLFRRGFEVKKPVKRAVVFVCGLGFYELRLNGARVGDSVIEPGWTDYRKRCLYGAYDVTGAIDQGANALGVMLGNGMYNVTGGRYVKFKGSFGPPKMILHLRLEYADGAVDTVVSDASWKTAPGPVRFSCIYGGEDYDARQEIAGWDKPAFDDAAWAKAAPVAGPGGRLVARSAAPSKVMREHAAVRVTQPKPGVRVYDLGQNMSGWPKLKVSGPAGAVVKMVPGELLDRDGLVSQRSSGGPVWFSYTLKGGGTEEWTPRFSYTGFRYVQIDETGWPTGAEAPRVAVAGQFIYNSSPVAGKFECSNPLVNRIHHLILAAIESNFQSVLTDCPHREKLGWLEVSHLLAGGMLFNFDTVLFYEKILQDMRDAQLPGGLVPDIAPEYTVFSGGFRDSPEWGSACVIAPWEVYQFYGNVRVLEENYDAMKRYAAYLGSKAQGNRLSHGLGDWYDIGPRGPGESQLTSKGLTATAIYYRDLVVISQTAARLGREAEARDYAGQAARVREAFNAQFYHPESSSYDRDSQTASAMPLALRLAPEEARPAVLDRLVANVRANKNRVTAGDVGFVFLVRALAEGGRSDVLYDMIVQTNGPGYAWQLKNGATTLTEAWDTNPGSSQNHCMLGHAEEWFYRGLGGLWPDPAGPGFKRFVLKPQVVGDLAWTRISYNTPFGQMASGWRAAGAMLEWRVTIPAGATAELWVPTAGDVREGGRPASSSPGLKFLRKERGAAVFEAESGLYVFESPKPAT